MAASDDRNLEADSRKVRRYGIASLVVATAAGGMVSGVSLPLVPLFFFSRGFGIVQLGWVVALLALAGVLVHLVARRFYKHLSSLGALAWISTGSGMLLPLLLIVHDVWQLVTIAVLMTMLGAIVGPAVQTKAVSLVRTIGPTATLGRMGMISSFGFAGGIFLGALVLRHSWGAVFWTAAVLSLIAGGISHGLAWKARASAREMRPAARPQPALVAAQMSAAKLAAGLQEAARRLQQQGSKTRVRQERVVRRLVVHTVLFHGALAMFPFFIPIFFQSHGISYAAAAGIVGIGWLIYAPLQAFSARYQSLLLSGSQAAGLAILATAGFLCLMSIGSLWVAVVAWCLLSVCDGLGRPARDTLVMASRRGASAYVSLAWLDSASRVARVFSPLTFAAAVMAWGFTGGLAFSALLLSASAVPLLLPADWTTEEGPADSTPVPVAGSEVAT